MVPKFWGGSRENPTSSTLKQPYPSFRGYFHEPVDFRLSATWYQILGTLPGHPHLPVFSGYL